MIVVCLFGGAFTVPHIEEMRQELGSQSPAGMPGQAPPDIILLTHILGGFRGLLVDAVWLRATRLQFEQKFWELYQLYDWMGKLEPRIEEIWDHVGWNMAYNLVAEIQDSEARWRWIMRAIELMRDQGLKYNPRSGKIMERISWIFYHKIGRDTDYHHYYYKARLAQDMHVIFLDRDLQNLKRMAEAPRKLEDLLADPAVASAFRGFQLNPPEEDIKKLSEINSFLEIPASVWQAIKAAPQATREKIQYYLTARIVRERLKMTRFDIMLAMEANWGKLDWRLPEPHAIYWAWLAADCDPNPARTVGYDRLVLFSLQELWRRGIIAYMPQNPNELMLTVHDLAKVEPINQQYELMLQKYSVERGDFGAESIRDGHKQFLMEAEFNLYFAGYVEEAARYHQILHERYGTPEPYMPVDQYCLGKVRLLVEEYGTRAKVRQFVDNLIGQTCLYYATNKLNEARNTESLAKRAWESYREFTEFQTDTPEQAGVEKWEDVLRENVFNILAGRAPFPEPLRQTLRQILNVPEGMERQDFKVEDVMVPKIPPSSPIPK
jgi:hypothetical protein